MNESVISEQGKIYSVTIFPKYRILNKNERFANNDDTKEAVINISSYKSSSSSIERCEKRDATQELMIFLIQIYKN